MSHPRGFWGGGGGGGGGEDKNNGQFSSELVL